MGAVVFNVPKVVYHWPWGRESQWPLPGSGAKEGVGHTGTRFMESRFPMMKHRLPPCCACGSPPLTSLHGVKGEKGRSRGWALHLAP